MHVRVDGSFSRFCVPVHFAFCGLLALAVGCGGGGDDSNSPRGGPSQAELAEHQQRVSEIQGWEQEIRDVRGRHHSDVTELVKTLKTSMTASMKTVESDVKAAIHAELAAFGQDTTDVPTNPVTLAAAKDYAAARSELEAAFAKQLEAIEAAKPAPYDKRPLSTIALRDLETMKTETAAEIAALATTTTSLAAVDPGQSSPPGVTSPEPTTEPPVEVAARPDPPNTTPTEPPSTTDPEPGLTEPTRPDTPSPPTVSTPTPEPPAKKNFLGPAPTFWTAKADPGARFEAPPANLAYRLPAVPSSVLYPQGPTRFAATGRGKATIDAVVLYDLHTGENLGTADGFRASMDSPFNTGPVISPDGTYLGLYNSSAGGGGVAVGNVKTKKPVALLPFPEGEPVIRFPTADRVLAVRAKSGARLWSLPDGDLIREFAFQDDFARDGGTVPVSPGGRFVAFGTDGSPPETIVLYDLEAGTEAGRLKPPKLGRADVLVNGLAFSPDGTELAAFVSGIPTGAFSVGEGVVVWDLDTGRLVDQQAIVKNGQGQLIGIGPEPLQWFPDGQGWLVAHQYVVDRKSAKIVHHVKAEGDTFAFQATKVIADDRVLRAVGGTALVPEKVVRRPVAD